jgi:hypothetical protein
LSWQDFFNYIQKKHMDPRNKTNQDGENVRDQQARENANVAEAHQQAEEDINQDPDLSTHDKNDDLDEGETARLGEDTTGLV